MILAWFDGADHQIDRAIHGKKSLQALSYPAGLRVVMDFTAKMKEAVPALAGFFRT